MPGRTSATNLGGSGRRGDYDTSSLGCANKEKPISNPRPDEGRLLTDEDIVFTTKNKVAVRAKTLKTRLFSNISHADIGDIVSALLKAQRDLTASIKDAEYDKLLEAFKEVKIHRASLMDEAKESEDECQARMGALIEVLKEARELIHPDNTATLGKIKKILKATHLKERKNDR